MQLKNPIPDDIRVALTQADVEEAFATLTDDDQLALIKLIGQASDEEKRQGRIRLLVDILKQNRNES